MFVYFIVDESNQLVKIGYSQAPEQRLKQICTANSGKLVLAKVLRGDQKIERKYHKLFARYKIRREWFELSPEILEFLSRSHNTPTYDHNYPKEYKQSY